MRAPSNTFGRDTDSRAGVTVYHPGEDPDLSVTTDLGTKPPDDSGCSCRMSRDTSAPSIAGALLLAVLGLIRFGRKGRA